jgi:hypothetical protein
MIENFEDYNFICPPDPLPNANQFEIESWKKQLDLFWKRRGIYMDNKMKLYSLIWDQSSKTTQSKVETHQSFAQCKGSYDSLSLLKILREFIFWSDNRQYKYKAEDQAKNAYYNLRQTPEMSCQEYIERVRNVVDVIKSLGGSLVDEVHLLDELPPWPAAGYTQIQIDQCMVYWFEWTGIDTESLSRKLKILTLKVAVITQVLQQKPTIYRSITKTITLEKGP